MGHVLALALLALDCIARAWRIQLAVWAAGGRLGFNDALRLNLYGEAVSQLTPNRLGGEPARFRGLSEAGVRAVPSIVAIGVEVAGEWPVFVLVAGALFAYYVPDWHDAARQWLSRHRAGELVLVELVALAVLVTGYLLQRLVRSGMIRHRVRRQWRVAWAHVRRAPWWVLGAEGLLTVVSVAARALILPGLAWGMADRPPFAAMTMLYIHPDECIDCGACVPACPVAAIYESIDATPSHQQDLVEANAIYRNGDAETMAKAEEIVKAHIAAHADIMAVPPAERQAAHARF